jgi:hypothetical protein
VLRLLTLPLTAGSRRANFPILVEDSILNHFVGYHNYERMKAEATQEIDEADEVENFEGDSSLEDEERRQFGFVIRKKPERFVGMSFGLSRVKASRAITTSITGSSLMVSTKLTVTASRSASMGRAESRFRRD